MNFGVGLLFIGFSALRTDESSGGLFGSIRI